MLKYLRPSGPGWRKLRTFCNLARRRYSCMWAWADTCCIDKRGSSELEESIRSMYKWYAAARVCIVYLADTTGTNDMHHDAWFTRGWTLQELLAPQTIKFFNKNWTPLSATHNDRNDVPLINAISGITNIPNTDLIDYEPGTDRISTKLGWAAQRQTTRQEDTAYSLIGLFGVSLTIAYGEGPRSFFRLQIAIMERTNDCQIFAWNGAPSKDNSMVAASAACFSSSALATGDKLTQFLELNIPYPRKSLADAVAQKLVPRGSETIALANGRLQFEVVLYPVLQVTLDDGGDARKYKLHLDGLADATIELSYHHETEQNLYVAVTDYERNDANNESEPLMSRLRSEKSLHRYAKVLNCDVSNFSGGRISAIVEAARTSRCYTAFLLVSYLFDHRCFERLGDSNIILVKRPLLGWKSPQTIFVV